MFIGAIGLGLTPFCFAAAVNGVASSFDVAVVVVLLDDVAVQNVEVSFLLYFAITVSLKLPKLLIKLHSFNSFNRNLPRFPEKGRKLPISSVDGDVTWLNVR